MQTFFTFQGQIKGTPMGSPITGHVAEIVLQKLEAAAFETQQLSFWVHYVGDTFGIIKSGRQADFKTHLNSIFTDMQFRMEEEKDGALSLLDVLVRRRNGGELTKSVSWRRPTLSKRSPTKATIRRHTKEAASKPYSNEWRHPAAHQKPKKKKNCVASNENSPSIATRAHSFRRLCGNGQQAVLFQDRAYGKQFTTSPTSQKQSPVFSKHAESELSIVQQEPCAADL